MLLNYKIKNFSLLSLLSAFLLTGCQYFPTFSATPLAPKAISTIETHNFSIDYEQNLIGTLAAIKTQADDTLPDIARHFGLGHNDIVFANPSVDPWLPEPDTRVLLPLMFTIPDAPRQGIVLNLANMRMFHFPASQPQKVATYPVGIGREDWNTPLGLTRIVSKTKHPTWNVPPSIQREHALKGDPLPSSIPSGPNNPLGDYAMRLARSSYLIHGTNKPYGVGMQMSHGCLNLYPEDISVLFNDTKVGTQVMIVDQPYLLGWQQEMLFLEAHKPLDANKNLKRSLFEKIKKIEKKQKVSVDWSKVEQVLQLTNGIPTPILTGSMSLQELSANVLALSHPGQLYEQPLPRPLTAADWSVTAATLKDNRTARKLATLLNHQGPTIPATTVEDGNVFQVIAGPFANSKEANTALKRIRLEFELKGNVNPPESSVNRRASAASKKSPSRLGDAAQEAGFLDLWLNNLGLN